jgi:squalene-associated FAD-dependent desaturase
MKVAVIGGGWAGLAAALHLHRAGIDTTVFEAARTLGGRARSVYSPNLNTLIDNGQHILLGAYSETQTLIKELGIELDAVLYRQALSLRAADGSFTLRPPALPAPLHLLGAIVCAHGLSLTERWRLIAINRRLQKNKWMTPPGWTVAQWLKEGRQSDHVIRQFWQPLCIAALNTPIEQACAQILANVLRDSLGALKAASDTLIPRVDLTSLWPAHLPAGIAIRPGHAVRRLESHTDRVMVDGESYDAVVVATNAPSAHRLLNQLNASDAAHPPGTDKPGTDEKQQWLKTLAAFSYIPIATVTLKLQAAWQLPHPMLMLTESPKRGHFGQWLFDRSIFMNNTPGQPPMLTVVISDARTLGEHTRQGIIDGVIAQIKEQTRRFPDMPAIIGHDLIVEKRATFAAVPHLQRPANATPWQRVWVAGDWTDTGYPAVLEGAVRSGKAAAAIIVNDYTSPSAKH